MSKANKGLSTRVLTTFPGVQIFHKNPSVKYWKLNLGSIYSQIAKFNILSFLSIILSILSS